MSTSIKLIKEKVEGIIRRSSICPLLFTSLMRTEGEVEIVARPISEEHLENRRVYSRSSASIAEGELLIPVLVAPQVKSFKSLEVLEVLEVLGVEIRWVLGVSEPSHIILLPLLRVSQYLVGLFDLLEFLLRLLLALLAMGVPIRVVLESQFLVLLLQLFLSGVLFDSQDFVEVFDVVLSVVGLAFFDQLLQIQSGVYALGLFEALLCVHVIFHLFLNLSLPVIGLVVLGVLLNGFFDVFQGFWEVVLFLVATGNVRIDDGLQVLVVGDEVD